jgi:hypothetical protein
MSLEHYTYPSRAPDFSSDYGFGHFQLSGPHLYQFQTKIYMSFISI